MTLTRSSLARPDAMLLWWAAMVLIILLLAPVPVARADCYDRCMTACEQDGASNRTCGNYCEYRCS